MQNPAQQPQISVSNQKSQQPLPLQKPGSHPLTKPSNEGYSKPEVHSDPESDEGPLPPIMKPPIQPAASSTNPKKPLKVRAAVSAEVYGEFNKKENFKARVIKKTPEEQITIKEKLLKSFLFKALDEKDLQTCIDAMEIKKLK